MKGKIIMTLKNRLLVAALLTALTALGSTSALANGNAQEIDGDFLTVEMGFARNSEYPSFNYNQVLTDYRAEINERVAEACNDRDFAIDATRIRFIYDGGPFLRPPVVVYGARLMAFCKD